MTPPVRTRNPIRAEGTRLVAIADLPASGVVEVETDDHGTLAVGVADGAPFAVSNVCRHQFAKLGQGRVTDDGCLECPWHRSRFDVRDGSMRSGPKGRIFGFPPYSAAVQAVSNVVFPLRTFAVEERAGVIHLAD